MSLYDSLKKIIMLLNREIPTDVLVKRGLTVGQRLDRQQGCFVDPTHCFLIEIGDDVTMSIRVTLMAHDASTKKLTGYTKIGKIKIGDRVFIGANATILPGVTVGNDAVIGAGSVVTQDVPAGAVVAGVPARVISSAEELKAKATEEIRDDNSFDKSYRMSKNLSKDKKAEMKAACERGNAYIE